jgi:hypothetical protein
MQGRQVKVRNTVNRTVVMKLPEFGINRVWRGIGVTYPIPFDVLEQALWQSGVKYLFETGILYIDDMQDKIDLGLEPADAKQPENIIVLNDGQKLNLLKVTNFEDFKTKIHELSKDQVDALIDYAIDNKIVDVEKCSYLKELTGRDILKIVSNQED